MASSAVPAPTQHLADRLGIWASAVCVVHCLLTPLLLSLSAVAAHLLPGEEATHRTLAVAVASLGAVALVRGYRLHRRRAVLLLMLCGVACIGFAAWFGNRLPSHASEVFITMAGSGLMIAAHRLNHTFCQQCRCADGCRLRASTT